MYEQCSAECLEKANAVLNAMSHPLRFEIIKQLSNGPKYNSELKKQFSQYDPSNITKHINILKKVHIIESVKEGRLTQYKLIFDEMPLILKALSDFIHKEFPETLKM